METEAGEPQRPTANGPQSNRPVHLLSRHLDFRHPIDMASLSVSTALSRTIRQIGRSRPRIYCEAFKRAASTKHPKNFSPPTTEELTELRDRVQDFTRMSIHSLLNTRSARVLTLVCLQGARSPKKWLRKPTATMHSQTRCGRSSGKLGTLYSKNQSVLQLD